jgi:hypothetical protein
MRKMLEVQVLRVGTYLDLGVWNWLGFSPGSRPDECGRAQVSELELG